MPGNLPGRFPEQPSRAEVSGLLLTDEPTTVGVVGGGQLCRMMGEAATPLGLEVVFLDPTPDAPASPVTRDQVVGGFDEPEALETLARRADVLTYDIELADPDAIEALDATIPVHPSPRTLRVIQDKARQKDRLADHGVPVPPYETVASPEELQAVADERGLPLMLKARRGGYDGRGNRRLEEGTDLQAAFKALPGDLMVESFVDYDRELSVIAVKGEDEVTAYPTTETIHREQILRRTLTPARTTEAVVDEARSVAEDVLEVMEGRGVYGVEMFEADGDVLVNEIAPRPHNSGHWTIEGAVTSQFEQHLRAVAGLPLGATDLRGPTLSFNVLGETGERDVSLAGAEAVLESPDAHLHWYGKRTERRLRKMGHVTLRGDDLPTLEQRADQLEKELRFEP